MSTVNRSQQNRDTHWPRKARSAYLRLSIRRHYEINSPRGQFPLHQVEPKRWLSSTKEILKRRYTSDRVHENINNKQQIFPLSEYARPPPSPSPPSASIMDGHYNFEGASELWITETILITMAHWIKMLEISLRTFVAERHDNDTYQLTNFKDVRGRTGANEGVHWQLTVW